MTNPKAGHRQVPADLDFDHWHARKHTQSIKWEFQVRDGHMRQWDRTDASHGEDRVLPMWVADMDFQVAKPIQDAVLDRAAHGLYGYAYRSEEYLASVASWMSRVPRRIVRGARLGRCGGCPRAWYRPSPHSTAAAGANHNRQSADPAVHQRRTGTRGPDTRSA